MIGLKKYTTHFNKLLNQSYSFIRDGFLLLMGYTRLYDQTELNVITY